MTLLFPLLTGFRRDTVRLTMSTIQAAAASDIEGASAVVAVSVAVGRGSAACAGVWFLPPGVGTSAATVVGTGTACVKFPPSELVDAVESDVLMDDEGVVAEFHSSTVAVIAGAAASPAGAEFPPRTTSQAERSPHAHRYTEPGRTSATLNGDPGHRSFAIAGRRARAYQHFSAG